MDQSLGDSVIAAANKAISTETVTDNTEKPTTIDVQPTSVDTLVVEEKLANDQKGLENTANLNESTKVADKEEPPNSNKELDEDKPDAVKSVLGDNPSDNLRPDDDLIRELEEIEGVKKVDKDGGGVIAADDGGGGNVNEMLKSNESNSNGHNTSNINLSETKKTSDLLKDLESDSTGPESELEENTPKTNSDKIEDENIVDNLKGNTESKSDEINETNVQDITDNTHVVSTTCSLKRKHSIELESDGTNKKANIEIIEDAKEIIAKPDLKKLNFAKNGEEPSTSEIHNKESHKISSASKDEVTLMETDDSYENVEQSKSNGSHKEEIREENPSETLEGAISSTSVDLDEKNTDSVSIQKNDDTVEVAVSSHERTKTTAQKVETPIETIETPLTDGQNPDVKAAALDASPGISGKHEDFVTSTEDEQHSTVSEQTTPNVVKDADSFKKGEKSTEMVTVPSSSEGKINPSLSDSTVDVKSSTCNVTEEVSAKEGDEKMEVDLNTTAESTEKAKISNKVLTNMMNNGSSTPNSNISSAVNTPTVFNSTPIQKQFEISSENVSKILDDQIHEKSENPVETTEDLLKSDTTTCTGSESEPQTSSASDNLTRYVNVLKQFNGLAGVDKDGVDNTTTSKIELDSTKQKCNLVANGTSLDLSVEQSLLNNTYEISVWYEENEMSFLSVERLNAKLHAATSSSTDGGGNTELSDKASTNGSVNSVGLFSLPTTSDAKCVSAVSSNSSSDSQKIAIPAAQRQQPCTKKTVTGVVSLCNFMIDHFREIKRTYAPDHDSDDDSRVDSKKTVGRKSKKNLNKSDTASPDLLNISGTPKSGKRGASSKRSLDKSDTEDEPKSKYGKLNAKADGESKQVKNQKKTEIAEVEEKPSGSPCLARWVDKKYYAGRVIEAKAGNKFVVLFEDGALKTLPQDYIVFGEEDILPLLDQAVHALVEDDTYEPGFVTLVKKEGDTVLYTVAVQSKTVTVTASDIYLEEDQAKMIQSNMKDEDELLKKPDTPTSSKRAGRPTAKLEELSSGGTTTARRGAGKKSAATPTTPEPGFSGNASGSGRKGRRTKRPQLPTRFSESSDISDTFESDSAPNSPDSAIEAIDGVQPELQKTPKETQINKMCLFAEYLGNDRTKNIEDVLGPLPTSKTIFRNKHFLLTCTLPMKLKHHENGHVQTNVTIDLTNKNVQFSTLPFFKEHLRNQIEAGGGIVYNHFEDVPKNKYKQCKLIAPHPCLTAKYVQCLAADIPAVSHEWIIQCSQRKCSVDIKSFLLPSGWSIIEERYKRWSVGRNIEQRNSSVPLSHTIVLLASQNKEFSEFWTRVCKLSGATIRLIKSQSDITETTKGYMLTDEEFPEDIKSKADHYQIPIVSTVWVVQSLILGKVCNPKSNIKLTQIYQDDDY